MFDFKTGMYIDLMNYRVGYNIIIGVFLFVSFGLLIGAYFRGFL